MSWGTEILEAASDLDVTPEEVTTIMSDFVSSALRGFVVVGIMTIGVRGFYDVIGKKKLEKQEKEILEMIEEVW